jgi:hypothetical protein
VNQDEIDIGCASEQRLAAHGGADQIRRQDIFFRRPPVGFSMGQLDQLAAGDPHRGLSPMRGNSGW